MSISIENQQVLSDLSRSNLNMYWGGVIAETCVRLGVECAVMAPGSRNMPIVVGFATNKKIETIPVLDERSAAFFALGKAMESGKPVVLFCSSGTAGAHFYPAIIEASISRVPLIVLTADRPPEGRDVYDRQTIDQQKLYGNYPRWYAELPMPEASVERLEHLRQKIIFTFERSLQPIPGPVHLNVPFCENPLAPVLDESFQVFLKDLDEEHFFNSVNIFPASVASKNLGSLELNKHPKGIIILGPQQRLVGDVEQEAKAIGSLSTKLGWPVLVDAHSHFRNFEHDIPNLITRYDLILRSQKHAASLVPDYVLHVGGMPISKILRAWLKPLTAKVYVLDECFGDMDCLQRASQHIRATVEDLSNSLPVYNSPDARYISEWNKLQEKAEGSIDYEMSGCDEFFEGKVMWVLTQHLPKGSSLFITNSMPPRDMEFFGKVNTGGYRVFGNRGANGIDGIISSAMGVAHRSKKAFLVTGDLAFLHDTNGLLLNEILEGSLTIILLNNNGGRIFENLPIHAYDEVFEKYVATPQNVCFKKLCSSYGIDYFCPKNWSDFKNLLSTDETRGLRVIEVVCDGKTNPSLRKQIIKDSVERL